MFPVDILFQFDILEFLQQFATIALGEYLRVSFVYIEYIV